MEIMRIQTCSIIWNYSSYLAGAILHKISPRTKLNWHCTIGFLILFFRKEYILFSNVYISVNMIFECCYLFFGWEIYHPLSTCATEGMEGGWVLQNVYRCIQGERSIPPHVYLRTYRQLLFSYFYLKVLVFTFIKKGVFLYIFEPPQKIGIRFS